MAESTVSQQTHTRLASLVGRGSSTSLPGPILYVHGPLGSGKLAAARAACSEVDRRMLTVDLASLMHADAAASNLRAAAREALLQDAVLALDGFDRLLNERDDAGAARIAQRRSCGERFDATPAAGQLALGSRHVAAEAATVRDRAARATTFQSTPVVAGPG